MLKLAVIFLCMLYMPLLCEGGGMGSSSEKLLKLDPVVNEINIYMTFGEETKMLRFIWPEDKTEKCYDFQALKTRKEFIEVPCKELLSKVWVDGAWRTITLNW